VLDAREGLREEVGKHFICRDILELNLLLLDEVVRVMIFNVDVFQSVVKHWVFRKSDTPLIIGVDHHRSS
jgi:hypothetical protein